MPIFNRNPMFGQAPRPFAPQQLPTPRQVVAPPQPVAPPQQAMNDIKGAFAGGMNNMQNAGPAIGNAMNQAGPATGGQVEQMPQPNPGRPVAPPQGGGGMSPNAGRPATMPAPYQSAPTKDMSQQGAQSMPPPPGMPQIPPMGMKKGGKVHSYTDKSGRINLGSGRVSTASKNSKSPKW